MVKRIVLVGLVSALSLLASSSRLEGQVAGTEYVAAVNLTEQGVWASAALFVPSNVSHVRCVMIIVDGGLASRFYHSADLRETLRSLDCGLAQLQMRVTHTRPSPRLVVRDATLGGFEALDILLADLAESFQRSELPDTPLLFWGHSAAGTFGLTYAALDPERTIGFVRYNSHLRDLPVDMPVVTRIPGLLIAGELDATAGMDDAYRLWSLGRSDAAPWGFAVQPGAPHSSERYVSEANALLLPWLEAVILARLDVGGGGLRDIDVTSGWLADHGTALASRFNEYLGERKQASWLPDEASALGWRTVLAR